MLAIVGLLTILVVMFLIMTKKCSTLVALIAVPMIACVIVGQGADMGGYITAGIKSVAATGVMFIFAVAFFGVMGDVGAFEIVSSLPHMQWLPLPPWHHACPPLPFLLHGQTRRLM